jgi:hypothetical protein
MQTYPFCITFFDVLPITVIGGFLARPRGFEFRPNRSSNFDRQLPLIPLMLAITY